jgi:tetrapyrrole methylase family protein/MazG family protein
VGSPPPRVVVAGLGPAGADLVPERAREALRGARRVFVRTSRHPAVESLDVEHSSFDELYERAGDYESLYREMARVLRDAAVEARREGEGYVAYAVPGSPFVAERSVALLREEPDITIEIVPAPSFLDLAWDRLGVDPLEAGVQVVDAQDFAATAAGRYGPLLVGHCHSRAVLSAVKLAVEHPEGVQAVVLHHLGLPDETVRSVPWEELDRVVDPDHLTSLWVPALAAPVAAELVRLEELVRTLRQRCPWDRRQTHGSLARHLLEEAYEALDAIETLDALDAAEPEAPSRAVGHLEEELGDLLFQVVFHCVLAAEEGRFTLADVAREVHDKLVGRHPHVFGDVVAETPEAVAERWEQLKKAEKGRTSVTEGIPEALPALALAATLQRKAESLGLGGTGPPGLEEALERLRRLPQGRSGETLEAEAEGARAVGEALFALADLARRAGVDPETALRARARQFRRELEAGERAR